MIAPRSGQTSGVCGRWERGRDMGIGLCDCKRNALRSGAGLRSHARLTAVSIAILVLATDYARALDPNRALTQAVHRIWQVQQGLPQATVLSIFQTKDG